MAETRPLLGRIRLRTSGWERLSHAHAARWPTATVLWAVMALSATLTYAGGGAALFSVGVWWMAVLLGLGVPRRERWAAKSSNQLPQSIDIIPLRVPRIAGLAPIVVLLCLGTALAIANGVPLAAGSMSFCWTFAGLAGYQLGAAVAVRRWETSEGVEVYVPGRVARRLGHAALVESGQALPARPLLLMLAGVTLLIVMTTAASLSTGEARAITARRDALRSLPSATTARERDHIDPALGRIASTLAGRKVEVRCWSDDSWSDLERANGTRAAGLAFIRDGVVHMEWRYCGWLESAASWGVRRPDDLAPVSDSIQVLTHEATHMTGIRDEALTDCIAVQRADETARMLGLEASLARRLQLLYWYQGYPDNPPEYRTADCREDGRLDRTPGDGTWP